MKSLPTVLFRKCSVLLDGYTNGTIAVNLINGEQKTIANEKISQARAFQHVLLKTTAGVGSGTGFGGFTHTSAVGDGMTMAFIVSSPTAPSALPNNTNGETYAVVASTYDAGQVSVRFMWNYENTEASKVRAFQFFWNDGTVENFQIPFQLSANTNYHIAMTYNNVAVKVFVNGQIVLSTAKTKQIRAQTLAWFGTNNYASQENFNGSRTALYIANSALSDKEVGLLYTSNFIT